MSGGDVCSVDDALLRIDGLGIEFGVLDSPVKTVNDVPLEVRRGETLGIIGESGSGSRCMIAAIG